MSKERLEEHTHIAVKKDEYKKLKEQAERVQELEELLGANMTEVRILKNAIKRTKMQNKRYREALEEIMKIQENHEWNLYGIAYGIAEKTLFEVEGEE